MKLKIKKLYNDAQLPTRAHATDAGMDLYAHTMYLDKEGNIVYGTGIAMEIPEGHVGLVFPRSSISRTSLQLTNSVGVIDSGYRGEVMAKFHVRNGMFSNYKVGERIAQLIVMPYPQVEIEEVNELPDSERGTGGYGSSGR